MRVGDLNMARYGTATASAALALAFDERANEGFTAAAPSLDAGSAIDDNLRTLWIAERFVGTPDPFLFPNGDVVSSSGTPTGNGGNLRFSQVYVNPPASAGPGARWIELILVSSDLQAYWIASANGSGAGSAVTLKLPEDSQMASGGSKIIIAENAAVFRRLNPLAEPALLVDINETAEYAGGNADFFDHLTAAGGDMWIFHSESAQWHGRVAWGDGHWGGGSQWPQYSGSPAIPNVTYGTSNAAALTPDVGETIRYFYNSSGGHIHNYWEVSLVKEPGYDIDLTTGAWIMVSLPGLGLKLAEDIDDSEPGASDLLRITADDGYSTAGLPSSGTLLIGDEQITYSSETDEGVIVTSRGANSTTATGHDKGDLIYLMVSSVATDAHLIASLSWDRNGQSNVPEDFVVYRSSLATVRNPDEDDWEDDWTTIASVTGNTANTWSATSLNARIRHVLIKITEMSDDPSRPRLNEIRAILDPSVYFSTLWLANGVSSFDLIESILVTQAGFPGAAVVETGTPSVISENISADDSAWRLAADIAEYLNCKIVVERDSTITIHPNYLWIEDQAIGYTWDDTNLADVALTWSNGMGVAQVKQAWRSPDGAYSGVEVYPATPVPPGEVLEIGEVRYDNDPVFTTTSPDAEEAARRRYIVNRYPVIIQIDSADGVHNYRPDGTAEIQWQFHADMQQIDRHGLVINVEHSIRNNQWYTSAEHQQIERESEF